LPVDARQYDVAARMLQSLDVRSVELMTNNPDKFEALEKLGIRVAKRIPVHIPANEHSAYYLAVKRERMRHLLPEVVPPSPAGSPAERSRAVEAARFTAPGSSPGRPSSLTGWAAPRRAMGPPRSVLQSPCDDSIGSRRWRRPSVTLRGDRGTAIAARP